MSRRNKNSRTIRGIKKKTRRVKINKKKIRTLIKNKIGGNYKLNLRKVNQSGGVLAALEREWNQLNEEELISAAALGFDEEKWKLRDRRRSKWVEWNGRTELDGMEWSGQDRTGGDKKRGRERERI